MNHSVARKRFSTLILLLWIVILTSCSGKGTATSTPSLSSPTIAEETITLTPPATETPTATPTLLSQSSSSTPNFGAIVFSMGDGLYKHLFVFDPYSQPMTRLTTGRWDDQEPAISPDGKQLAFSSNRDHQWDIYVLDLSLDTIQRITNSKTYDGSPYWSPDGQFLVFQTLNGNNLDILIQSVADLTSAPIQLTVDAGDNFDPAWSPDGHTIAFATNRSGRSEIWLADLQSADNRFTRLASSEDSDFISPAWSPDGAQIAWCRRNSQEHIEVLSIVEDSSEPREIGLGCQPAWSPDGSSILATFQQPNSQYLVAYDPVDKNLTLPMIRTQSKIQSMAWIGGDASLYAKNYGVVIGSSIPETLYETKITLPATSTGRNGVVDLSDVKAPNAFLSDTTNESFNALRYTIGSKVGWDLLATLDNAYLPITVPDYPGLSQNWLFTGRAISLNSDTLSTNWIAVSREDFQGETYWRVWVKCLDQTGQCGEPMQDHSWDFSTRYNGNLEGYEEGGTFSSIPDGYWIDFTEFAARFGWERNPAQSDWRYYFPGTLYNQFVFREGLTWKQAMLQMYPLEAIEILEPD